MPHLPRRCLLVLGLLALLGATSCRSAPPAVVSTPYGDARAETKGRARKLAVLLRQLAPRVAETLPDTRGWPDEVWLSDFADLPDVARRHDVVGLTELGARRVRVRDDRLGRDADFVLTHELVHALLGESWDPLPALMKEGLCDSVASRLAPDAAVRVRAVRLVDASFSDPGMALELWYSEPGLATRTSIPIPTAGVRRLDPVTALEVGGNGLHGETPGRDESALYGYGLLLTDRIVDHMGFDGLHDLCVRARAAGHDVVPAPWLLAAAGLDARPATWRAALLGALEAPELAAQAELLQADISGFLVHTFRNRYPGLTGEDFLDRSLPTLGWQGGDTRVAVAMVDGLRSDIVDGWRRSGPRPLGPGDGWWLRDEQGVHLTSLLPPSADEPHHTVSRLALGDWEGIHPLEAGEDGRLPTEQAEVEAWIQIGRDGRGTWLRSLHPQGLRQLRVSLDGVLLADLARDLNTDVSRDDEGWMTVLCRLPGALRLEGMLLFDDEANLVVTQQAEAEGAPQLQFPLRVRHLPRPDGP